MKERYYTPSIEEFHVGFEYEVDTAQHNEWKRHVHTREQCLYGMQDAHEEYRVKYLDVADIEECGFKYQRTFDKEECYKGEYPTKIEFELNDVWQHSPKSGWLVFIPELHQIKITTLDEGFNQDGPNNSVKFNGICKNKSELKVLMKQLGI